MITKSRALEKVALISLWKVAVAMTKPKRRRRNLKKKKLYLVWNVMFYSHPRYIKT